MTNVTKIVVASVVVAMLLIAFITITQNRDATGSASPGIAARVATSSTSDVGTDLRMDLYDLNVLCSARIITTATQPIRLSFFTTSSTTLSGTVGHLQLASTTVAYPAGQFGCALMTAIGVYSSTTITKTETE